MLSVIIHVTSMDEISRVLLLIEKDIGVFSFADVAKHRRCSEQKQLAFLNEIYRL
jgi:hypothetical protein